MKTKQIYYDDPYKTKINSKVIEAIPSGNLTNIILDQTIFYPEGGGQPCDRGTIGDVKVEYVRLVEGEIVHQVKGELEVGQEYECEIDWNWRFKYMKIHTAGHLLHDVLMSMVDNLTPIKGSHGKKPFLEYSGELDESIKEELEGKLADAIDADLPVVTKESSYEELEKECKFMPPNLPRNKPLRMIKIGDYSPMPDGGVHVKSTDEIEKIWIANITVQNGVTNIRYGAN